MVTLLLEPGGFLKVDLLAGVAGVLGGTLSLFRLTTLDLLCLKAEGGGLSPCGDDGRVDRVGRAGRFSGDARLDDCCDSKGGPIGAGIREFGPFIFGLRVKCRGATLAA